MRGALLPGNENSPQQLRTRVACGARRRYSARSCARISASAKHSSRGMPAARAQAWPPRPRTLLSAVPALGLTLAPKDVVRVVRFVALLVTGGGHMVQEVAVGTVVAAAAGG